MHGMRALLTTSSSTVHMFPPSYLRYTSGFFASMLVFYLVYGTPNVYELGLVSLLGASIVLTQLFWRNPVLYTNIHIADAIVSRITIMVFVLYTITTKAFSVLTWISYVFLLSGILGGFYYSHYYSSKQWCSSHHIKSHIVLHLCCYFAACYAFLPSQNPSMTYGHLWI